VDERVGGPLPKLESTLSRGLDFRRIEELRTCLLRLLFRHLQFPCVAHQFLEFALDLCVADVLVLQHAIRIDSESVRNRSYCKQF
jgi:hypothetical protein